MEEGPMREGLTRAQTSLDSRLNLGRATLARNV